MHILIVDQSVHAYKSFRRLFSQDYEGETQDQEHEFTRQYISELVYLQELHKPDGIVFAMDCPRDEIWRHRVVRKYYGPRLKAHAVDWMPGTENKNPNNACRWYTECYNTYKTVWTHSDGSLKSKHMTKKAFTDWAKEENELTLLPPADDITLLKKILPHAAKMYKGARGGNWPASSEWDKDTFKEKSQKLCQKIAPNFGIRLMGAPELEADDIAFACCNRWHQHDITVATIDVDWIQLGLHMSEATIDPMGEIYPGRPSGQFRFWNMNKYEFEDTLPSRVKRLFLEKIMSGDDSDNIEAARLRGQAVNIGEKKCDKIFDEVPLEGMYQWLREHGDPASLAKNSTLINLAKCPVDLQERAEEALLKSAKMLRAAPEYELTDLVSETTLHMAKINGQKERAKLKAQGVI